MIPPPVAFPVISVVVRSSVRQSRIREHRLKVTEVDSQSLAPGRVVPPLLRCA